MVRKALQAHRRRGGARHRLFFFAVWLLMFNASGCTSPRHYEQTYIGMSLKGFRKQCPDALESRSGLSLFKLLGMTTMSRSPSEEILLEEYQFFDEKLVSITVIYSRFASFEDVLAGIVALNGNSDGFQMKGERRVVSWTRDEYAVLLTESIEYMPLPKTIKPEAAFVLILHDNQGLFRLPAMFG